MRQALIASVLFSVMYGITIVLQQSVVQSSMEPLLLTFVSYCFALVYFIMYMAIVRPVGFLPIPRNGLKWAALTALTASVIGDCCVVLGIKLSTSVNWSILSRLSVPGTFLLAIILLGEKKSFIKLIAVIIAVLGAYLVVIQPGTVFVPNRGDFFFAGAILAYSSANIVSQLASRTMSSAQITLVRMCVAIPLLLTITLIVGGDRSVNWLFAAYNGFTIFAGISVVTYVIKTAGASFFSVASNLIPIFTVIFSFFFLHTLPTHGQITGGALVITSILLFQSKRFVAVPVRVE